jgi:WD40 repeat protein
VYAAGADKLVYVWDIQNGFKLLGPWEADTDKEIRALDVVTLNNRELLAVASGGQVVFLDTATGKVMPSRTLHLEAVEFGNIRSMAVTQDGSLLAVGSDDGKITVWELNAKKKVSAWCAFPDPQATDETTCSTIGSIRGMTFSPDGKFLVSGGSEDVYARLWEVSTGTLKSVTPESSEGGHTNTVSAMAFNGPDEVITASWDNTVRVWRLDGEERKFVLIDVLYGHANSIWTVTIHPNGKMFASGSSDESVILWKTDQLNQIGTQVAKLGENVWALAIAPNRKQVAAGDGTGRIQLWNFDGTSLTELKSLEQNGDVFSLSYSPDGRILVSAGNEGTIHFWNTETGVETDPIEKAHDDQIWSVAFSPDGRYLASASFDQKVKIWDVTTHKQIGAPLDHKETIYALAFNKDGSKLLVAGYGSNIHVWDMRVIGQPVKLESLEGHEAAVNSISFNPQLPNVFASTSDDKTLRIWNIENEKVQVTSPVIGFGESMEAVVFHPNGKELASATNNKTVLLWDWTMDCSWDKNECQPDRLGSPLVGHTTQVQNVLFLSDTKLLSSSEDGQLILWDLDKLHWYEKACSIVNEKWDAQTQSQNTDGKIRPQLLNVQAWWVEHVQKQTIATPSCLVDDPS